MDDNILQIERKKLDDVLEEYKKYIEELELRLKALNRTYENSDYVSAMIELYSAKLNLLKRTRKKLSFVIG